MHLLSVHVSEKRPQEGYPFTVPLIQQLSDLHFSSPITILVGENGSGKSTLIEAIAAAVGSIRVAGSAYDEDPEMEKALHLAKYIKLKWKAKTRKGFFLRAEDFITYAQKLTETKSYMQQQLDEVERDFANRSELAKNLARMPYARSLYELKELYGEGLDTRSHGESFFDFFHSRFVPGGLYILDEPETPLSPLKQLSFLYLLKDAIQQGAQFIIATHSPIIMAYPHATLLAVEEGRLTQKQYSELEHVQFTRAFLERPEQFLQHL